MGHCGPGVQQCAAGGPEEWTASPAGGDGCQGDERAVQPRAVTLRRGLELAAQLGDRPLQRLPRWARRIRRQRDRRLEVQLARVDPPGEHAMDRKASSEVSTNPSPAGSPWPGTTTVRSPVIASIRSTVAGQSIG